MKKLIVYTYAYNAEKTIERTINSILSQTEQNWVWYLVDNGSTDNTSEIIMRYADKDPRIIPMKNKINNVWEKGISWWDITKKHDDSDFLCFIDADDEYKPEFLEKMLRFIFDKNLDVAVCGYDFIDSASGRLLSIRKLEHDLFLDSSETFNARFTLYHQFMRTMWCKLYKVSLLSNFDFSRAPMGSVSYGADTIFTTEAFRNAGRVGILSESLYLYYVAPTSVSYRFDNKRIESDRILDKNIRAFLVDKCDFVSPSNNDFLLIVYFNAIKDTLNILLNAQIPVAEKFVGLQDIFISEQTRGLLAWKGYSEQKEQLFKAVTDWLLSQKECRKSESAKIAADILSVMHHELSETFNTECLEYLLLKIPETIVPLLTKNYNLVLDRLKTWFKRHEQDDLLLTKLEIAAYRALNKPDDEIFALYLDIKKKRPTTSEKLNIDVKIKELISQQPLLQGVSISLASVFSRTIKWVFKADITRALDEFISASHNINISDNDAETYIMLGQNLSAAAENIDAYIYFKKVWISYLFDCSREEEASKELDEFEQILPDDQDFIELRKKLER